MEKRDIHGVVFDMDGLMFDSERIVKYSWDVAGERMGYGSWEIIFFIPLVLT